MPGRHEQSLRGQLLDRDRLGAPEDIGPDAVPLATNAIGEPGGLRGLGVEEREHLDSRPFGERLEDGQGHGSVGRDVRDHDRSIGLPAAARPGKARQREYEHREDAALHSLVDGLDSAGVALGVSFGADEASSVTARMRFSTSPK